MNYFHVKPIEVNGRSFYVPESSVKFIDMKEKEIEFISEGNSLSFEVIEYVTLKPLKELKVSIPEKKLTYRANTPPTDSTTESE